MIQFVRIEKSKQKSSPATQYPLQAPIPLGDRINFYPASLFRDGLNPVISQPQLMESSIKFNADEIAFANTASARTIEHIVNLVPSISTAVLVRSKALTVDYENPENYQFPLHVNIWEEGGNEWDFWSDIWGLYTTDWDLFALMRSSPNPQCISQCDSGLASDQALCDGISAGVMAAGLSITVGATVGTAITGPGAGAVFVTGVTVSVTVAGATNIGCKGWAWYQHSNCRRRC